MQNSAFSEASDGSYYNNNVNSGTMPYAANITIMW